MGWLGIARKRAIWDVKPVLPPHSPAWVRAFTALGRPVVAVIVMVMCAPGEHHLATLAGWDGRLAWGMAAVLAAYAGIAAAVAGERRKGDPGHVTAAVGAVVALVLAMAAQPVSHIFVTGHLSAEPRPPLWLVVVVSCVPPLVLGHLLHLAATPKVYRGTAVPEVPEGLLTTKEVAVRLGIKPSSVHTRVHRGSLIPAMRDQELGNLFDPETLPRPELIAG